MTAALSQIMTPSRVSRRPILCPLVSVGFLVLAGCVNLDDIAQLSKLADDAQRTLPAVVADTPVSCERQNLLLDDIPSIECPPDLLPQDCKPFQQVAEHLTKDQNVLIAYFDALGKLASNTPLSCAQTVDSNGTTIEKLPNLTKGTIVASSAAQEIAKVWQMQSATPIAQAYLTEYSPSGRR